MIETFKIVEKYPSTRYMGSKYKILPHLHGIISDLKFDSCLDAFSGSGVVSYYFKGLNKQVFSNDFMHFPYMYNLACIENSVKTISKNQLSKLLLPNNYTQTFIFDTFKDLYFTDEENQFLDNLRSNIELIPNKYQKAIALSAIVRACLKKRPRGLFTYVGARYDDGRKDLQKSLKDHFIENVNLFNEAVFNNGKNNTAFNQDVFSLDVEPDLVYLDPPYHTVNSDNDYTRRYHFVEGLVRNWDGLEIQTETKTKKFKKYITPFDNKRTVYKAFEDIFLKFQNSILVVSYSSNSLPTKDEMIYLLKTIKRNVALYEIDYLYSHGTHGNKINDNANKVKEYIFVAT